MRIWKAAKMLRKHNSLKTLPRGQARQRPKWYFTFDCHFGAKFIQSAILYATLKSSCRDLDHAESAASPKTNPRPIPCRVKTHVIKRRLDKTSKNKYFVWKIEFFVKNSMSPSTAKPFISSFKVYSDPKFTSSEAHSQVFWKLIELKEKFSWNSEFLIAESYMICLMF